MLRRSFWVSLALLFACLPAHANVPLPGLFAFALPFWLGATFFFSFLALAIVVETAVLTLRYHRRWHEVLRFVVVANLASTVVGFLFSFHSLECMVFLAFFILLPRLLRSAFGWSYLIAIPVAVLCAALVWLAIIPAFGVSGMVLQVYGILVLAFGLTLLVETLIWKRYVEQRDAWRWSLSANVASYAVLFALLWAGGFNSGVIAYTQWPIERATRTPDHDLAMTRLQEVYMWERSARSWRFGPLPTPRKRLPYRELRTVSDWARQGDVGDAEDLYILIGRYREPQSLEDWQNAKASLERARAAAAGEPGGTTPEKPLH